MTEEKKLTLVKNMTDETDDEVITAFLDMAKDVIMHQLYPFQSQDLDTLEMPDRYGMNQVEISAYLLNKRGADGELHHMENGVLRIYGSEAVPASMLQDIIPQSEVLGSVKPETE